MSDNIGQNPSIQDWKAELMAGDQDYASAIGWEPSSSTKKLLEEAKKRDPKAFAPEPEMLLSRPLSWWLEIGVRVPPGEYLFGPFWQKDELSILFAGTGIGKSALGTQIGEALARGVGIAPFDKQGTGCTEPQRVLYLDFELHLGQLAMRYSRISEDNSKFDSPYDFSDNFIRSELHWNGDVINGYDGFSDMFFRNISNEIYLHEATVLIVDNITFLDRSSTSNAHSALSIMRGLNRLKQDCFISILVLAHTSKRQRWQPLSDLDLQGSVNLSNFADSMFAMGQSRRGPGLRYLKHVKVRSGKTEYGADCVPVFSLEKFDNAASLGIVQNAERPPVNNFLGFRFMEFGREQDQLDLHQRPDGATGARPKDKKSVIENARRLAAEGKSSRKIAAQLGISRATASRYVSKV